MQVLGGGLPLSLHHLWEPLCISFLLYFFLNPSLRKQAHYRSKLFQNHWTLVNKILCCQMLSVQKVDEWDSCLLSILKEAHVNQQTVSCWFWQTPGSLDPQIWHFGSPYPFSWFPRTLQCLEGGTSWMGCHVGWSAPDRWREHTFKLHPWG